MVFNPFRILNGKSTRRSRYTWDENVSFHIKEIGVKERNYVNSVQDKDYWRTLVNVALNPWVP